MTKVLDDMELALKDVPSQFTYKEFKWSPIIQKYYVDKDYKSLDAVLLANLQKLRNKWIIQFVSRGVYSQEVKEMTCEAVDLDDKLILSPAQAKIMQSMVDYSYSLVYFKSTNSYALKDSVTHDPVNYMACQSLIKKGYVKEVSDDIAVTVYKV